MNFSVFYIRSPEGDEIIRRGRTYARQNPGSAATNDFLRSIPGNPEFASLYAAVPNKGNLHSEIGRQIRDELGADVYMGFNGRPIRIPVKGAVHKSYTPLILTGKSVA